MDFFKNLFTDKKDEKPSQEQSEGSLFGELDITTAPEPSLNTNSHSEPNQDEEVSAFGFVSDEPESGDSGSAFGFMTDSGTVDAPEEEPVQVEVQETQKPTVQQRPAVPGKRKKRGVAKRPGQASEVDSSPAPKTEKPKSISSPPSSQETPEIKPKQERSESVPEKNINAYVPKTNEETENPPPPLNPVEETHEARPSPTTQVKSRSMKSSKSETQVEIDKQSTIKIENAIRSKLQNLEDTLNTWQSKVDSIEISQQNLLNSRCQYHLDLIELLQVLKKVEVKQVELIEAEKYEEAEEINNEIKDVKIKMEEIQKNIILSSQSWIEKEEEKGVVFAKLTSLRKEFIQELKILEDEQSLVVEEANRRVREENKQYECSFGLKEQRIDRDIHDIDVDLDTLNQKYKRIQNVIQERTTTHHNEIVNLNEKRTKVQSEINELLARIEVLRKEEKEYTDKISKLDGEVETVKSKYQKEISEIEKEKSKINEDKKSLELEKKEIFKEKEKINKIINELVTNSQTEEKLLADITGSIANSREYIKGFDQKAVESQEMKLDEEHNLDVEINEQQQSRLLTQSLVDLSTKRDDLSTKIVDFKSEIRTLEQSIKTIQETLPNLDTEKKNAAKVLRNFKLATQIQNQIAQLQENLVSHEKSIKEKEESLKLFEKQHEELRSEYEKREEEVKTKEKELDLSKLEKLKKRSYLQRLQIRRAHRKNEGNPNSVSQMQIQHYEIKLKTTRAKITLIYQKHGLEEEPEPELPEDDSELDVDERNKNNVPDESTQSTNPDPAPIEEKTEQGEVEVTNEGDEEEGSLFAMLNLSSEAPEGEEGEAGADEEKVEAESSAPVDVDALKEEYNTKIKDLEARLNELIEKEEFDECGILLFR
eukprot:TRINITY_DN4348_c0_g1_i3.p1 TRINITY_DN4348_c0_g1~~TRINITY_DN4348_c0_g1_i3.p1  ORF type:complete len:880 (+),score=289.04 TRINITY_DN4348_c0_g1_i3:44-2683(+)